jgi:hypothetical protein
MADDPATWDAIADTLMHPYTPGGAASADVVQISAKQPPRVLPDKENQCELFEACRQAARGGAGRVLVERRTLKSTRGQKTVSDTAGTERAADTCGRGMTGNVSRDRCRVTAFRGGTTTTPTPDHGVRFRSRGCHRPACAWSAARL